MVLAVEDLLLKSVRLSNAMQVSPVEELAVDWGISGQGGTI